jgi:hypothetical protein
LITIMIMITPRRRPTVGKLTPGSSARRMLLDADRPALPRQP